MENLNAADARDERVIMRALKIRRQRRIVIACITPPERLLRKIIVANVKIAGKLFEPAAQHRANSLGIVGSKCLILSRWNAQTKE